MKKFVLAALIGATILTPLAATAQERGQWRSRTGGSAEAQQQRGERQAQREDFRAQRQAQRAGVPAQAPQQPQRQNGGERPQRQWNGGERAQRQVAAPQQPQAVRPDGQQARRGWGWGGQRDAVAQRQGDGRRDGQSQRQGEGSRDWQGQRQGDGRRDWEGQRQGDGRRDWQGQQRQGEARRDWQDRRRQGEWRDQQARRGYDGRRDWSGNWRQDRRYDWSNHRRYNRNVYRLPRYYAPSGWGYGYRRFSIGLTLGSMLFAQNYWINDPFYYRLPPAYGPYRWVRYYNDALLVDIDTGQVVDVEYDIFW